MALPRFELVTYRSRNQHVNNSATASNWFEVRKQGEFTVSKPHQYTDYFRFDLHISTPIKLRWAAREGSLIRTLMIANEKQGILMMIANEKQGILIYALFLISYP